MHVFMASDCALTCVCAGVVFLKTRSTVGVLTCLVSASAGRVRLRVCVLVCGQDAPHLHPLELLSFVKSNRQPLSTVLIVSGSFVNTV